MDEDTMEIVLNTNNTLIFDECGRVCLRSVSNGLLQFVPLSLLPSNFLHDHQSLLPAETFVQEREQINENEGTTSQIASIEVNHIPQPDENLRAYWTRTSIISLIASYKKHQTLFKSTKIRNSDVWKKVAEDVQMFNAKQCEAKFKYLKGLFVKKKDNIGPRSSGAPALSFEYFDEFNDIFSEEPNIVPLAIASSSSLDVSGASSGRSPDLPEDETEDRPDRSASAPSRRRPKTRRTRLEVQMEKFQKAMIEREGAREKRLNKFLEHQEKCSNRLCTLVEKLIEKL